MFQICGILFDHFKSTFQHYSGFLLRSGHLNQFVRLIGKNKIALICNLFRYKTNPKHRKRSKERKKKHTSQDTVNPTRWPAAAMLLQNRRRRRRCAHVGLHFDVLFIFLRRFFLVNLRYSWRSAFLNIDLDVTITRLSCLMIDRLIAIYNPAVLRAKNCCANNSTTLKSVPGGTRGQGRDTCAVQLYGLPVGNVIGN